MRPVDTARSRIVLLGTPYYDSDDLADVPVVANNITDLQAVFTDPRFGAFPPGNCVVVPTGASTSQAGELLVQAAEEAEDLLLFYYAGHGLLSPRRKDLYLSLAGTRPGSRLEFTALAFEAVRNACLESRAENRAVILDSCYSGRAIGETLAGGEEEILGQIHVAGTYTLTSAPANRLARILEGEEHTAFTERLLALLTNGTPSAGDMLSFRDIYQYLNTQLRAQGLHTPQQCGTDTADHLGLIRNQAASTTTPVGPEPAQAKPVRPHNRRSTGSTLLDSLFEGIEDGLGQSSTTRGGKRKEPSSKIRSTLGSAAWQADFIVDSKGTANVTRDPEPVGDESGEEDIAEFVPRYTPIERGYWSIRITTGWLVAASGLCLGLVNLGLAVWVLFGPASDSWLWLLLPGVPIAFGAGFSHVVGVLGLGFNLIWAFGYLGCAVESVVLASSHKSGTLTPPSLAILEIALIAISIYRASPNIS